MYFNKAYDTIGQVPINLLDNVAVALSNSQITDKEFNYIDYNVQTKAQSWMRIDFTDTEPTGSLRELHIAVTQILKYVNNNYGVKNVNSSSISMLKPKQILDEHIDGRFVHRLCDRFLVPITDSDQNYNYGYINGQKVVYQLRKGFIYRINNAVTHSAVNLENANRYNILIDTIDPRLKEKFKNHPDLMSSLQLLTGNKEFEKRLKVKK